MEVKNCVALVTGANRGLGKAMVEALLAAGAGRVYAGAREPRSIVVTDGRLVPIQLDVTEDPLVNAAAEACRTVNVLINNAGIMTNTPMLAEGSEAALRAELEVNVFGTLRMIRAFASVLGANGGGVIANVLSVASWVAYPHNATYGASKHAALALTDAARFQLKAQGTRVIGVFSGYIDTDMAASVNLPKISPRLVADRTLAGIRGDHTLVCADERTEATWKAVRGDPEAFHAKVQQMWDASQT